MSNGNFLYPNVTSLPGQSRIGDAGQQQPKKDIGAPGEFDSVLQNVERGIGDQIEKPLQDLNQLREPLKFSGHAMQRLKDRRITLDQQTMMKVSDAVDKADAKGVEDTLVLTKDAALIVSVKNRTIITAMDRNQLTGNVFTNIDGAVIV
jgi:flagellar operon protein